MSSYLPFLIAGLVTGSVYGLAATGLVLTYKTSGVFNFGHGAIATVAAYAFYDLHVTHHVPWPVAVAMCVLLIGPALGLVLEVLARRLSSRTLAVKVAATVGVLLAVRAGISLWFPNTVNRAVAQYLPTDSFEVEGVQVHANQIIVAAVAVLSTVVLSLFFRVSRLGLAMRAVVEDPDLLDSAGTSPVLVRRCAWMIGTSFAAASGVLIAPLQSQLDTTNLTFLVVTAFGAAAIGSFTNLPMTYAGGLLIGVGQALCTKWFNTGFLTGLNPALPFVVLFVVLLVAPKRRLVEGSKGIALTPAPWKAPVRVQVVSGVALLVVLGFVPNIVGFHLNEFTMALSYVLLFLSLGLLVRTSGQVSLAHVSFMAIGVCTMSHLTVGHHVPWVLALVLSGLVAVPIGAILSIPAIRLSGLYLALATFGFGILLQYMFYTEDFMFGDTGLGLVLPRPSGLSDDTSLYYVVLALVVLGAAAVVAVNATRLGRLLRGLSDSPTGLATSGASINVTRVMVFCFSAFLASIAGALQGVAVGNVTGDSYQPLQSLLFFALIMISAGGEPWYAIFAAFGLQLPQVLYKVDTLQSPETQLWLQLVFGASAIAFALTPPGLRAVPEPMRRLLDRAGGRRAAPASNLPSADPARPSAAVASGHVGTAMAAPTGGRARSANPQLEVTGLTVRFGGLVAVDSVALTASPGRVTGLIGPNGAGKTTTFNACSGLNRPSSGRVRLAGRDVTRLGPSRRARLGLGRTFQQMELFDSLSVWENVALGAEAPLAGWNPIAHMIGRRGDRGRIDASAQAAMSACGIADISERVVGSLATGQRRLVELARCLAGPYDVLLLDEPSSGLDRNETEAFGAILREVVGCRGVAILLVEHDMSLVTSVCDFIYVLDFGKPLFEGDVSEVLRSHAVRSAYLGEQEDPAAPELDPLAVAEPAAAPSKAGHR